MKNNHPWVSPLTVIPLNRRPFVATQKTHYSEVLNPACGWGRMPPLFWLDALFVSWQERRRASFMTIPSQGMCDSRRAPHA